MLISGKSRAKRAPVCGGRAMGKNVDVRHRKEVKIWYELGKERANTLVRLK
jgi:hypothetical protein